MIEADFQRFYHLDLRVQIAQETPRRLLVLIQGLPADAATWRPDTGGWTTQDELAAGTMELMDSWFRILALVGGAKKQQLPKQVEIERPERGGEKPQPKRRIETPDDLNRLLKGK